MVQKKSNSSKAKVKHGARVVAGVSSKKDKAANTGPSAGKAQERRQKGQFKKEKPSDKKSFEEQLVELGLHVKEVTADGNCFFRAVADQLEGKESSHASYRQRVVDFIESHKDDFEPFVEDDVPFADYCATMREQATWAGNLELQAASLLLTCNICIHQLREPRWNIVNFDGPATKTIHLSYHDGVHYNSVRRLDDPGQGPALPVSIEADRAGSQGQRPAKHADSASSRTGKGTDESRAALAAVVRGFGFSDEARVAEVLRDVGGDTAAAIEYLIAQRNAELDDDVEKDEPGISPPPPGKEADLAVSPSAELAGREADPAVGPSAELAGREAEVAGSPSAELSGREADLAGQLSSAELAATDKARALAKGLEGLVLSQSAAASAAKTRDPSPSQRARQSGQEPEMAARQVPKRPSPGEPVEEVRVSRNRACPCGSRKKYKACCGAGSGAQSIHGQKQNLTNKERKEQLRHEKDSQHAKAVSRPQALQEKGNTGSGDLGSLCI